MFLIEHLLLLTCAGGHSWYTLPSRSLLKPFPLSFLPSISFLCYLLTLFFPHLYSWTTWAFPTSVPLSLYPIPFWTIFLFHFSFTLIALASYFLIYFLFVTSFLEACDCSPLDKTPLLCSPNDITPIQPSLPDLYTGSPALPSDIHPKDGNCCVC